MASTYVNDLRLNELATGDGSGTWGTTTNTNFELIGEALGFGTEAITTNADTHTSTVADGASDQARAMFIKYTGTLDSTCTITIAPNTLNRVHIIENATSGSQSIIISQGSGANVTILTGQTKAVYLDGAGSGAAVTDAFVDMNFGGTTTIADNLTLNSDSAVVSFGADADTTLTHTDGSGLTLNGTNKIMFNDATQFIQGSSATVLSIGATNEIDLTATAIDINGTVDISSTLAVTGIATFTDDIIIGDGKTIGSASDVDAMTIASNGQVTFTQTLIGTALDISGSIDIDGTTNLDAVDIDGTVQMGAADDDVRMTFQGNNQYRLVLKNASNASVILGSGGANNFRISNSSGSTLLELTSASNLLLPTAGAGIYLGVTSEATSNLLDDYEEGVWTCTVTGSSANPSTAVTEGGTYTKIGRMVYAHVQLSNKNTSGASGAVRITGLPFEAGADNQATGNLMTYVGVSMDVDASNISPYVGGTGASFYASKHNAGWAEITHNPVANFYLSFSVTYVV